MQSSKVPAQREQEELLVEWANPENVAPFGALLTAGEDGTPFGDVDAKLEISGGVPRFYIMTLFSRPLRVSHITRHMCVTQCLASMEGKEWIIVLAPPADTPDPGRMRALRFSGAQALCMSVGTWHAGPLTLQPSCNFINLELSDTNIVDHDTVQLGKTYELAF